MTLLSNCLRDERTPPRCVTGGRPKRTWRRPFAARATYSYICLLTFFCGQSRAASCTAQRRPWGNAAYQGTVNNICLHERTAVVLQHKLWLSGTDCQTFYNQHRKKKNNPEHTHLIKKSIHCDVCHLHTKKIRVVQQELVLQNKSCCSLDSKSSDGTGVWLELHRSWLKWGEYKQMVALHFTKLTLWRPREPIYRL